MIRKSILLLLGVSWIRLLIILYSVIILLIGSVGGFFLFGGIPLIELITETKEILPQEPEVTPSSKWPWWALLGAFCGYEAHIIKNAGITPWMQLCIAVGWVSGIPHYDYGAYLWYWFGIILGWW